MVRAAEPSSVPACCCCFCSWLLICSFLLLCDLLLASLALPRAAAAAPSRRRASRSAGAPSAPSAPSGPTASTRAASGAAAPPLIRASLAYCSPPFPSPPVHAPPAPSPAQSLPLHPASHRLRHGLPWSIFFNLVPVAARQGAPPREPLLLDGGRPRPRGHPCGVPSGGYSRRLA